MITFAEPMLYFSILFSKRYLTIYKTPPYVNAYVTHTDNYLWTNENIFKHHLKVKVELNEDK